MNTTENIFAVTYDVGDIKPNTEFNTHYILGTLKKAKIFAKDILENSDEIRSNFVCVWYTTVGETGEIILDTEACFFCVEDGEIEELTPEEYEWMQSDESYYYLSGNPWDV